MAVVRVLLAVVLLSAMLIEPDPVSPNGQRALAVASTTPNVVVVMTDDQRFDTLSLMPQIQDRLVRRGVRFTQAMVPTALCCPSRASFLTGNYAHDTGVYSNVPDHGGAPAFRNHGNEERTIALALDREGYRTGLVGKYLNSFGRKAAEGYVPPGWDEFVTWANSNGRYYDYELNDGTAYGADPDDYSTDVLRDRATDFVRSTPAQTPLFLYFAPFAPHLPATAAPRHEGTLDGQLQPYAPPSVVEDVSDKPLWISGLPLVPQASIDTTRRQQLESLLAVDEAVAAIIESLRETGRMDNTLFVFTSDNGFFWGEHHLGGKSSPHSPATRIPLVMRWDGRLDSGAVDRRLALNIDVTTTIAAAASATMATQGIDLLETGKRNGFVLEAMATFNRPDGQVPRPAYCGWRTRYWMYAKYADGEAELYSYRDDPHELDNLAYNSRWREQRKLMKQRAMAACLPVPPGFAW